MPNNLTDAHEITLLDASLGNTDKLALMTADGSDPTAGTEVTGGSYARQTLTFGTGANPKVTTASLNYTSMPACTLQGWEVWDSAGSNRKWYGLFSQKSGTAQATGDTITITGHGYVAGQKIVFQSTYAPAGLTANTTYFVAGTVTTNTFQVSATSGGSVIDITADLALTVLGSCMDISSGATFTIASGQLTFALS